MTSHNCVPQSTAYQGVCTSCRRSAAAHARHILILARELIVTEAEQCVRVETNSRELCIRPGRAVSQADANAPAQLLSRAMSEGRGPQLGCLPGRIRLEHRLHASLHVEDRPSAESFRPDCSAPTPSGHPDCQQGLSLRAMTGGGSQPQHAHRAQQRPGKGRLFLCR